MQSIQVMQDVLHRNFKRVFTEEQAEVLSSSISEYLSPLVTKDDFDELKGIVRELAQAQKELTQAQKRTEVKVGELVEAQKELTEVQKRTELEIRDLTRGLKDTRSDLGGLSRSFSYAFENEAYRMIPGVLERRYGVKISRKIIRAEIGGKEVNFFAHAERDSQPLLLVGEAKTRLDKWREDKGIFAELEDKVSAVLFEYPGSEVIRLLVTHFATGGFLAEAEKRGVLVIQSQDW